MGPGGPIVNPATKSVTFSAFLLVLALLCIFGIAYCSGGVSRHSPAPSPAPNPAATPAPVVMVLENGVVYFELTGDDYIKALQAFYKDNPALHCDLQGFTEGLAETGVNSYAHTQRTVTTGFILHCHDLAVEAQNKTVE
jgi:hypothetical protein